MAFGFGSKYSAFSSASSSAAIAVASVVVNSGDKISALCTYGSATTNVTTLTDGTNTYTKKSVQNITGNAQTYEEWECANPTPGTYTLSFDPGGTCAFRGVACCTETGLDTAAAATVVSNLQAAPGTGTNAVTSGNLTPLSQPGGILVWVSDDDATTTGFTQGTGFADQGVITNWDAAGLVTRIETQRLTSPSAIPGTFTAAATPGNDVTFATYTPEPGAGGGGSAPTYPQLEHANYRGGFRGMGLGMR